MPGRFQFKFMINKPKLSKQFQDISLQSHVLWPVDLHSRSSQPSPHCSLADGHASHLTAVFSDASMTAFVSCHLHTPVLFSLLSLVPLQRTSPESVYPRPHPVASAPCPSFGISQSSLDQPFRQPTRKGCMSNLQKQNKNFTKASIRGDSGGNLRHSNTMETPFTEVAALVGKRGRVGSGDSVVHVIPSCTVQFTNHEYPLKTTNVTKVKVR